MSTEGNLLLGHSLTNSTWLLPGQRAFFAATTSSVHVLIVFHNSRITVMFSPLKTMTSFTSESKANWNEIKEEMKQRDRPVIIGIYGDDERDHLFIEGEFVNGALGLRSTATTLHCRLDLLDADRNQSFIPLVEYTAPSFRADSSTIILLVVYSFIYVIEFECKTRKHFFWHFQHYSWFTPSIITDRWRYGRCEDVHCSSLRRREHCIESQNEK